MPSPDIALPGSSTITPGSGMPGATGSRMKMSYGLSQSVVQAMKLEIVLKRVKNLSVEIARNMGKPTNSAGGTSDTGSQTAGMLSTLGGLGRTTGSVVGRAGVFAAGLGAGFMPNVEDAVSQRIMSQSISSLSGKSNASIVAMTNKLIGGGATSSMGGTAAAQNLQGLGIAYGSKGFGNIMGQVGGLSVLSQQSNEAVASGYGGINAMKFLSMGIRARDSRGNLRDPSKIASEVYSYLYRGKRPTVENVLAGLGPHGKVTAALQQITGGDQNLMQTMSAQLLYQAKNGGKPLDTSDPKKVMDDIMHLEKNDPMRMFYEKNKADTKRLQATAPGQVQGYADAVKTVTKVTDKFADLITKTGALGQAFSRITAFATTLPMAGGVGSTLAGGAMSLGGAGMMAMQARGVNSALTKWESAINPGGPGPTAAAGPGMLAKAGMFAAGAGLAAGTSFAIPKLREFGAKRGIKKNSNVDRFGTMAGYAGGYAASGALMGTMFGPVGTAVGAVLGTGYGLYKGYQATNQGGDTGPTNLRGLLQSVGFKGNSLDTAVGIVMAESGGGNALAHNTNASTGDNSFGLFQINMLNDLGPSRAKRYGLKMYSELFDPKTNAKAAWDISGHGKHWDAWTTYTAGKSSQYEKANPTIKFNATDNAGRNWLKRNKGGSGDSSGVSKSGSTRRSLRGEVGSVVAPSSKPITARFGQKPKNNSYWKWRGFHTGVDYGDPAMTPVKAVAKGKVVGSGKGENIAGIGEPYGNVVLLEHDNGYKSLYAHLTSSNVKVGDVVDAGKTIGLSGQTGSGAKGPHLHFEIRKGKDGKGPIPLDPMPFLQGAQKLGSSGVSNKSTDFTTKPHSTGAVKNSDGTPTSDIGNDSSGSGTMPSILSSSSSGVTSNTYSVSSQIGGDMGTPPLGNGMDFSQKNIGGGVTINMNVTLTNGGTGDARRLAAEVKNILQSELRMSKIGNY